MKKMSSAPSEALVLAKPKKRLDYIDALRGIAAVLVVIQHIGGLELDHMAQGPARSAMQAILFDYADLGKVGVVAFFAISGFVIPFSFRGERPLRSFVISRFFRLYPAYWLSLIGAIVIFPLIAADRFTPMQIAANATMIQAAFGQPDCIGVYWTLFIEVAFYGLCFAAFGLGLLKSPRYVLATIATLYILAWGIAFFGRAQGAHPPMSLILGLMVMHVGTLTRMALLEQDRLAQRLLPLVLGVLAVGLVPVCWYGWAGGAAVEQEPWFGVATSYMFGLGLFLYCTCRRAFANRITIYLGAISYALYLFHAFGLKFGQYLAQFSPPALYGLVLTATTLCVGLALSSLVFHLIEAPAIKLGHHVAKKLRWPGTANAARAGLNEV